MGSCLQRLIKNTVIKKQKMSDLNLFFVNISASRQFQAIKAEQCIFVWAMKLDEGRLNVYI